VLTKLELLWKLELEGPESDGSAYSVGSYLDLVHDYRGGGGLQGDEWEELVVAILNFNLETTETKDG
jgi:hypothetical protein